MLAVVKIRDKREIDTLIPGVTRFSCRGNRSLAIFFGARQRIPLARGLLPCNERTRPTDLTLARFAAEAMP